MATRLVIFDGENPWVFEGSYQDFLDRIGWKDEENAPKAGPTLRTDAPKTEEGLKRKADRRDLRRLRAEMITSRSRTLNPLQERIQELEAKIMSLEERVREDNMTLLRASQQGAGKSIAALSIAIYESRKTIEKLFDELELLSAEFHVKSQEFETKFKELEQNA
jgi:ATP-binding cassette subfamily F protein 3